MNRLDSFIHGGRVLYYRRFWLRLLLRPVFGVAAFTVPAAVVFGMQWISTAERAVAIAYMQAWFFVSILNSPQTKIVLRRSGGAITETTAAAFLHNPIAAGIFSDIAVILGACAAAGIAAAAVLGLLLYKIYLRVAGYR